MNIVITEDTQGFRTSLTNLNREQYEKEICCTVPKQTVVTCIDIHSCISKNAEDTIQAFEGVMHLQAGGMPLCDIFDMVAEIIFKAGYDHAFHFIKQNERAMIECDYHYADGKTSAGPEKPA